MGVFLSGRFVTDFAIRTSENQKRMEYMSGMTAGHEEELKALYQAAGRAESLNELSASVTDVVRKYHDLGVNRVVTPDLLRKLFSMHGHFEKSAEQAYSEVGRHPPYAYFDGTQLLNSFLGLIVLPYERFSNIPYSTLLSLMKRDTEDFGWIEDLIERLYIDTVPDDDREFIFSSYKKTNGTDLAPGQRFRVLSMWRHLRNSFAHSGDGSLFFFPISDQENMRDITHIGFFDKNTGRFKREAPPFFFVAKLSLADVRELAARMNRLIRIIEENEGMVQAPLSFEEAKNMARNAPDAGRTGRIDH